MYATVVVALLIGNAEVCAGEQRRLAMDFLDPTASHRVNLAHREQPKSVAPVATPTSSKLHNETHAQVLPAPPPGLLGKLFRKEESMSSESGTTKSTEHQATEAQQLNEEVVAATQQLLPPFPGTVPHRRTRTDSDLKRILGLSKDHDDEFSEEHPAMSAVRLGKGAPPGAGRGSASPPPRTTTTH